MSVYTTHNLLLQDYRNISVRLIIKDYNFNSIDELSGVAESISLSNDSTSDIRRTASISMTLDSGYTNSGILNEMYFSAGNGFWFDKYLQINIGISNGSTNGEIVYYPQGTYLINEPSVDYDAENNTLSFSAVDMMAKLTGLRSGNLQGIVYEIPANSKITSVMQDILVAQGFYKYILNEPEVPETPYDIKIESDGTTYQLLSELRDINSNWEIFFDVDGTFVFQKIPSGQIGTAPTYNPSVIANDTDWNKLLISYNLSTSFEEVKNYVEIYGKTIEPTLSGEVNTSSISSGSISVTCSSANVSGDIVDFIMFVLGDTSQDYNRLNVPVTSISFTDKSTTRIITCTPPLKYNNMAYMLRAGGGYCEYLGYQQPCAIAWENNEASPFYVGDNISENSNLTTPTDEIIDDNVFKNIVRMVCSGDEYDNIYSNQLAIDRAIYELYQNCRLHDTITITCVPMYDMDTNKMIAITLPNEDAVSYWLIKSVNTDFSATGTQTITAMRYYPEYPSN